MHEFENSWLFQREKIDNLSKNNLIIKKINSFFKSDQDVKLMDLGTGTGSNFRFLSRKIKQKKHHQTLIDISKKTQQSAKNKNSINQETNKNPTNNKKLQVIPHDFKET